MSALLCVRLCACAPESSHGKESDHAIENDGSVCRFAVLPVRSGGHWREVLRDNGAVLPGKLLRGNLLPTWQLVLPRRLLRAEVSFRGNGSNGHAASCGARRFRLCGGKVGRYRLYLC